MILLRIYNAAVLVYLCSYTINTYLVARHINHSKEKNEYPFLVLVVSLGFNGWAISSAWISIFNHSHFPRKQPVFSFLLFLFWIFYINCPFQHPVTSAFTYYGFKFHSCYGPITALDYFHGWIILFCFIF